MHFEGLTDFNSSFGAFYDNISRPICVGLPPLSLGGHDLPKISHCELHGFESEYTTTCRVRVQVYKCKETYRSADD